MEKQRLRIENVDVTLRRNNLIVKGIPYNETEAILELADKIGTLFYNKLEEELVVRQSQVYRKGPFNQNRIRSVVYKAENYDLKIRLLSKSPKLKGGNIYLSHDYTPEQETARYHLRVFAKSKLPEKSKIIGATKIMIGNETFKYDFQQEKVIPDI